MWLCLIRVWSVFLCWFVIPPRKHSTGNNIPTRPYACPYVQYLFSALECGGVSLRACVCVLGLWLISNRDGATINGMYERMGFVIVCGCPPAMDRGVYRVVYRLCWYIWYIHTYLLYMNIYTCDSRDAKNVACVRMIQVYLSGKIHHWTLHTIIMFFVQCSAH